MFCVVFLFEFYGVIVYGLDIVDDSLIVQGPLCGGDFFLYRCHDLRPGSDGGKDAPLPLVGGDAEYGIDNGFSHGMIIMLGIFLWW